jgi:hypothetical protein
MQWTTILKRVGAEKDEKETLKDGTRNKVKNLRKQDPIVSSIRTYDFTSILAFESLPGI